MLIFISTCWIFIIYLFVTTFVVNSFNNYISLHYIVVRKNINDQNDFQWQSLVKKVKRCSENNKFLLRR